MTVAVDNEERHQNTKLRHQLEEEEPDIGTEKPIVRKEDQDIGIEEPIVKKMEADVGGEEN